MRKSSGAMIFVIVIVLLVFLGYFNKNLVNSITGNEQSPDITIKEEVQLGLECAPQLATQFGGLYRDRMIQDKVKAIGQKLVSAADTSLSPYKFDFHVLVDSQVINAFAVPGGQIFITMGLLKKLKTDDEIAGILAHEMGHIIGGHTKEISQGNYSSEEIAGYVDKLINLIYNNDDELKSDEFAVKYMLKAGYKPEALVNVMKVLGEDSGFKNMHPVLENRIGKINFATEKYEKLVL